MDVLRSGTLLLAVSGGLLCQTAPPSGSKQFTPSARLNWAADPAALSTLPAGIPETRVAAGSISSALVSPARFSWTLWSPATATVLKVPSFDYNFANDDFERFPVKLGRLRYTFWDFDSRSNRPAGGRLQSLVDGMLRHYTSDPVVPVNKRCLRALSCNSLYEDRLRRRSAPSMPR